MTGCTDRCDIELPCLGCRDMRRRIDDTIVRAALLEWNMYLRARVVSRTRTR